MAKRYIDVGSWNIEHFGKRGGRKESVYALAEHIEMASLDVLALQEVYVTNPPDETEKRNDLLDGVLELVKEHTGHTWAYELFANRSEDDRTQLCGVAWNQDVLTKQGDTHRLEVDTGQPGFRLWDRMPHAVGFRYGDDIDFLVVSLHMKSNYGGATKARRVRHREAQTLVEQVQVLRDSLGEQDIILLGDTNCLASHEPALEVLAEAGFEDLNTADSATYVGGAPFDRIFIPEERKAFKYSRQYIMVSANPHDHDKYLSDHYLVKTVLKIHEDDDGDPQG